MKIAITGGTGCLGHPLLERLIDHGHDIRLLVLPNEPIREFIKQNVTIVRGVLSSKNDLNYLTKECEVVFHLAGKVHSVPKTQKEEDEFFRINVQGTENIIRASNENKIKRIIFYSTVGVYGRDADFHGDEFSKCNPTNVYAKSKYLAEQLVLKNSLNGGSEGVVLRFPVVYGVGDRGNVAKLIDAVRKKYFVFLGKGDAKRSMISAKNTAKAAVLAAIEPEASSQVFCVTDGKDYSINQLIESICISLNTNWRPIHIPILIANGIGKIADLFERHFNVDFPINSSKVKKLSHSLTFSCEKVKQILKFTPDENLQEGISREVEWLKNFYHWK
ncbi:MAG: NAD-dependent epimerase/dehydratase family protein [Bacteroidales bacterium]|nr:NAD-dependent epimerase/dehydratase family protein [Bacteroidales bacterium]